MHPCTTDVIGCEQHFFIGNISNTILHNLWIELRIATSFNVDTLLATREARSSYLVLNQNPEVKKKSYSTWLHYLIFSLKESRTATFANQLAVNNAAGVNYSLLFNHRISPICILHFHWPQRSLALRGDKRRILSISVFSAKYLHCPPFVRWN